MNEGNAYPPAEFTAQLFNDRLVDGKVHGWNAVIHAAGVLVNRLEADLLVGFALPGPDGWPGWVYCRGAFLGRIPDPLAKAALKRVKRHLVQEPIYDEATATFTGSGFRANGDEGRRVALEAAVRRGWVRVGRHVRQADIDEGLRTGSWNAAKELLDRVKRKEVRRDVEQHCRELLRLVQEILIFAPSRKCGHPDCFTGWTAGEVAARLDLGVDRKDYAPALLQSLMAWGMVRRVRTVKCPGLTIPAPAGWEGLPDWKVAPGLRHFVHYPQPEEDWRKRPQEAA